MKKILAFLALGAALAGCMAENTDPVDPSSEASGATGFRFGSNLPQGR